MAIVKLQVVHTGFHNCVIFVETKGKQVANYVIHECISALILAYSYVGICRALKRFFSSHALFRYSFALRDSSSEIDAYAGRFYGLLLVKMPNLKLF